MSEKLDGKLSLTIIVVCLLAIVLFHLVFLPELKDLFNGWFAVADVVLSVAFAFSSILMYKNDIDARPRIVTILLAIIICVLIGIFCSQYRVDKQDGITYVPEQEQTYC